MWPLIYALYFLLYLFWLGPFQLNCGDEKIKSKVQKWLLENKLKSQPPQIAVFSVFCCENKPKMLEVYTQEPPPYTHTHTGWLQQVFGNI